MNDSTFASLGLIESILANLLREGYERPTPIQTASIPPLLEGRDLLGCAQTGTGKTAAFALPIIQRLSLSPNKPNPRSCRVLVVAPTRELAAQIDASFEVYGRGFRLAHACVFGGVGKAPQVKALSRGVDVLVATPGRLLDLQSEGQVRLNAVEIVVLDEADRMLDMGFIRDVRKIIALLPAKRQTLLFSATMPSDIAGLASSILRNPIRVSVSPDKPAVELIDQKVAFVEKNDKRAFLAGLIHAQNVGRALVFTRTKHGADRLVKSLESSGIAAAAIHANKSQNNRTRTMDGFRSGSLRILVATDLAARGIDVDGITHVFNFELPDVPETYVHRIGRTARAGASGMAVALCDSGEKPLLRAIEKILGRKVPVAAGPDFESAEKAATTARLSGADREVERPRREYGQGGRNQAPARAQAGRGASLAAKPGRDASRGRNAGNGGSSQPNRGNARGGQAAGGRSGSPRGERNEGYGRRGSLAS